VEVLVLSGSLTSVWSLPFCFYFSPFLGCFRIIKFGRVSFQKERISHLKLPENCVFVRWVSSHLCLLNTVLRVPWNNVISNVFFSWLCFAIF
jgi:hypothetical protein